MKIVFVHQNFPGQFVRLARVFVAEGHEVVGIGTRETCSVPGVKYYRYKTIEGPDQKDYKGRYHHASHRMQYAFGVAQLAHVLAQKGFEPDLVVVNTGWGENLFLKDVWPKARHIAYLEFYHLAKMGVDIGFDPEFPVRNPERFWQMRIKNAFQLGAFDVADAAVAPTQYQRSLFPPVVRDKLSLIHDGIDTQALRADPNASISVRPGGPVLDRSNPVVTYVTRNIEPMRGSHIFIRSIPEILKLDPKLQVVVLGGSDTSYGSGPGLGRTWYQIFRKEIEKKVDWSRVHFVGQIPYDKFVRVLQVSAAHVYLTYPFVLSWSLIEAMSLECNIIASDTDPVREVIEDGVNGRLFPFFDKAALVDRIRTTLQDRDKAAQMAAVARKQAIEQYDFETVCLPQWRELLGVPAP